MENFEAVVTKKFEAPTTWNQMSREQLLAFAEIFSMNAKKVFMRDPVDGKGITIYRYDLFRKMRIMMMSALLKVTFDEMESWDPLLVVDLLHHNRLDDFLFEEVNLTKQLMPEVVVAGISHLGPGDFLIGTTIDEFFIADRAYLQFRRDDDEDALAQLCAILYRPRIANYNPLTSNKAPREAYNKFSLGARIELFQEHMSKREQYAAAIFFEGCRANIARKYKHVFQHASDAQGSNSGPLDVLLALAGGKFGDFETTCATDVHTAFTELNRTAEDAAKASRQR